VERIEGYHVVLVGRGVARGGRVCTGVNDPELRQRKHVSIAVMAEAEFVQFFVAEEERVRLRSVRVEVDDVCADEVARQKEVERVCVSYAGSGQPFVCLMAPCSGSAGREGGRLTINGGPLVADTHLPKLAHGRDDGRPCERLVPEVVVVGIPL
jgi:hypothetical protein